MVTNQSNNPYKELLINTHNMPKFYVDFSSFHEVKKVNKRPAMSACIKIIFLAMKKSAHTAITYSSTSFKHIVLGYYGNLKSYRPTFNIALIILKIAFWSLQVFRYFCVNTAKLASHQIYGNLSHLDLLGAYAGDVNVTHMKTKEAIIDVSHISSDLKVDELMEMLTSINFENKEKPGYMLPSSCIDPDSKKILVLKDLKTSLATFINHVKNRTAFVGTPPQYDTPRLMKFYQHIENSVRFSIHKVKTDYQVFKNANPGDSNNYSKDQLREYNNLLENQARVALTLAVAGGHCGARYMGEATELYYLFNPQSSTIRGTLKETLQELLAYKRINLAKGQIEKYLGKDTHSFSNYMGTMGKILAIPGVEDVTEHLAGALHIPIYLKHFFKVYDYTFISDAIKEKIKHSNEFREQIIDWLKTEVKDWNCQASDTIRKKNIAIIEEIKQQNEIDINERIYRNLIHLKNLISDCHNVCSSLIKDSTMEEFLNEFFSHEDVMNWLRTKMNDKQPPGFTKVSAMQSLFSEYGLELFNLINKSCVNVKPLNLEQLNSQTLNIQKTAKIKDKCPDLQAFNNETLHRILTGAVSVEESLKSYYERQREDSFYREVLRKSAIDLTSTSENLMSQQQEIIALSDNGSSDEDDALTEVFATKGISPLLMEYLLVSQGIILPQQIEE